MNARRLQLAVTALFVVSGVSALVYQVVWTRLLARIVGSSAAATAIVLCLFLGGLAIGAAAFGRFTVGRTGPLRRFGQVEVALAVLAFASPLVLVAAARAAAGWSPVVGGAVVFGAATLMGMTVPLMSRIASRLFESGLVSVAAFYSTNTLGAACGALVAPFVLMPTLGLAGAIWVAAAGDLVVGLVALRLSSNEEGEDAPDAEPESTPRPVGPLVAAGLLGAAGLALEVVYTRVLVMATGASVHALSITLATFLLGIAIGAWTLRLGRTKDGEQARATAGLVTTCLLLPPVAMLGILALGKSLGHADVFGQVINQMLPAGTPLVSVWARHALWSSLAMLGPAILLGRAFPLAVRAYDAGAELGEGTGRVYAVNGVGSALGALACGFALIPLFGLQGAFLVGAVGLPLLAAVAVGARALVERQLHVALAALVTFVAAVFIGGGEDDDAVVSAKHGHHASVAVIEGKQVTETVRALRVNGKVVATTAAIDMRLQRLLGTLPALLHEEPRSSLVIGMGTGMTAGSLLSIDAVERVTVVEISAAVLSHGTPPFAAWNLDLLNSPRVELVNDDGRHFLARTDAKFDVITADPIHPWTAGSSDLYSYEQFASIAAHLGERGVASQWLPLYQLSEDDVKTVVASWCEAFPSVSAWLAAYDLILVGSHHPHLDGAAELESRWRENVREHLAEVGMPETADVLGSLAADDAALRAYAGDVAPMRDDLPILEFRAPRSYLSGYTEATLAWIRDTDVPSEYGAAAQERGRELRAAVAQFLVDLPNGWSAAAERFGLSLLRER